MPLDERGFVVKRLDQFTSRTGCCKRYEALYSGDTPHVSKWALGMDGFQERLDIGRSDALRFTAFLFLRAGQFIFLFPVYRYIACIVRHAGKWTSLLFDSMVADSPLHLCAGAHLNGLHGILRCSYGLFV